MSAVAPALVADIGSISIGRRKVRLIRTIAAVLTAFGQRTFSIDSFLADLVVLSYSYDKSCNVSLFGTVGRIITASNTTYYRIHQKNYGVGEFKQ